MSASQAAGALAGKRVLVSAGPTFEDIDPVRFIGNRSSGRMGFAAAQAAVEQGAQVQLIAGPVHLPTPMGVVRVDVRSARDMREAVMARASTCDIYIGAAAVGDFRAHEIAAHKLKKSGAALTLSLHENPDILAAVAALKPRPFVVGFAAETQNVEAYARAKLERKKLDLIAANQVGEGRGFDACENEILLISRDGAERLARADKLALARQLLLRIIEKFEMAKARSGVAKGKAVVRRSATVKRAGKRPR